MTTTHRLCPYCTDVHAGIDQCPFQAWVDTARETIELAAQFPSPQVVQWMTEGETWTPYDDQDLVQQIEPMALADRGVTVRWLPLGVVQVYEGDQA